MPSIQAKLEMFVMLAVINYRAQNFLINTSILA
jgi:hypothetical protein